LGISSPVLVVVNDADDACPTTHTNAIFEAITHEDREKHHISGANHYYSGKDQKPQLQEALSIITDWIGKTID
jgi:esterase/lipase